MRNPVNKRNRQTTDLKIIFPNSLTYKNSYLKYIKNSENEKSPFRKQAKTLNWFFSEDTYLANERMKRAFLKSLAIRKM